MADKIKSSYKFSKSFYDDAITQGKWWSKLYFKLLWGGVDDNEIARRVLDWIPDDFKVKAAIEREQSGARIDSAEREQARSKVKAAIEREQSGARIDSAEREQARSKVKAAIEREQSGARIDSAEREQARSKVKAAIEREQSGARIDSAEREQARSKIKLLDVPVGTAVFTTEKYRRMKQADITCLDYSRDMLEQAEYRFRGAGITNIKTMQGDVGALPFEDETFDYVLCMNGLHVFPNKDKAYSEILRTLKPGGELLACFYVAGEQKAADWLAKTVMTRMGWFTPPFDTVNDVRKRLEPYYDILDFHVEGAMLYFRARKRP